METQALFEEGHGIAPGLIYGRGVPDTIDPDKTDFDKKDMHPHPHRDWILPGPRIRQETHGEDREGLPPLVAALRQHRGRVEFVSIPIGHAGTTLIRTLDHLTAAFSTDRPRASQTNANKGTSQLIMDSNAKSHDYLLFKSLLDALNDLAHARLLGIIKNMKRLVEA